MTETITLHAVPPSHPCATIDAALRFKGLEFERVDLQMPHAEAMQEIYGEGNYTVPGLSVGDRRVHGSLAAMALIEELAPSPTLYPEPHAGAIREAERWGDAELQPLGRCLPWGALYFRPEAFGVFGGVEQLDAAGVDFAIRFVRGTWKYHQITAQRIYDDLQGLPAKLDHVDALIASGVLGATQPNAADLQIAATLRVLQTVGDVAPLLADRPAGELALTLFGDFANQGEIPAGAFPRGWVPGLIN